MSGTPTQTRAKGKPFHFAESRKESHCKTRLELATPALTSNAASLSFWGKVVLYQLSYFRICFTNSAHFWLRSLRESKLSHSRGKIPRSIYKQKKTANSCPQERKTRLELATPTLARLCSTNWAISAFVTFTDFSLLWRRWDSNSHDPTVTTPSK